MDPVVRARHRERERAVRGRRGGEGRGRLVLPEVLQPDPRVRGGLVAKDTALFIFTSGTTGLPKAARITHARVQLYMRGFAGATGSVPEDKIYVALPLYHATGGLCALGAAWLNGGQVVLKRRFTATHFWTDIAEHGCTMFVYIGELCRYLANQPEVPAERLHKLRRIFGNGLQADVWRVMLDRFQVQDVLEFYGSTEGNVSLFNFDGKVGAIARIPRYLKKKFNVKLVMFDVEALYIFPWAMRLEVYDVFGLVEMGIFIVILVLGLVYAWRKGVLKWV